MKLKHIHIDNYKVFKDFDIDFCLKGKPQSLIVISGDNGSGKTTLFRDIISGIVITNKSKSIITAQEDNNIYTFTLPAQSETEEEKYIKNFSKVRFYPTDTNISATQLQDKILSYVDKLVYEDSKTNFEAYAEIQSLIDNIFKGFDLQISFKGISQNKQFVFVNPAKEEFGIEGLSNGEQQILSKVFVLFIETIKDHVILIDNLEKSLHPVWQIRILSVLRSYAKSHDCQIMVITQSPLIIASAHKEEIRFFIRENDGFVKAKALNDSPYGWTIEKVLSKIQAVQYRRVPEIEDKLSKLEELIRKDKYDSDEFKQLLTAMEKMLGFSDPDLALIRMEAIRKKKIASNRL